MTAKSAAYAERIGEYLGVDPTVVRLLCLSVLGLLRVGIILYIAAAILMPTE